MKIYECYSNAFLSDAYHSIVAADSESQAIELVKQKYRDDEDISIIKEVNEPGVIFHEHGRY